MIPNVRSRKTGEQLVTGLKVLYTSYQSHLNFYCMNFKHTKRAFHFKERLVYTTFLKTGYLRAIFSLFCVNTPIVSQRRNIWDQEQLLINPLWLIFHTIDSPVAELWYYCSYGFVVMIMYNRKLTNMHVYPIIQCFGVTYISLYRGKNSFF